MKTYTSANLIIKSHKKNTSVSIDGLLFYKRGIYSVPHLRNRRFFKPLLDSQLGVLIYDENKGLTRLFINSNFNTIGAQYGCKPIVNIRGSIDRF